MSVTVTDPETQQLSAKEQHRIELSAKYDSWANRVMILVSLIFLIAYFASRLPNQSSTFVHNMYITMVVAWVIFVIDYTIRVLLSPHRLKYIAEHPLTLLSIVFPPLRALIGFRALFLLIDGGQQRQKTAATAEIAGWFVLLAVSFGSIAEVHFEAASPNGTINTLGRGVWWSFETISTVGYGDYTPITFGGRVVAVLLMLVGVGLISTVSATLASGLIHVGQRERRTRRRGARNAQATESAADALAANSQTTEGQPEPPSSDVAPSPQPPAPSAEGDTNDDSDDSDDDLASSDDVRDLGEAVRSLVTVITQLQAEVADLKQHVERPDA